MLRNQERVVNAMGKRWRKEKCRVCGKRETETKVCEPCFEKVQLIKIRQVIEGRDSL